MKGIPSQSVPMEGKSPPLLPSPLSSLSEFPFVHLDRMRLSIVEVVILILYVEMDLNVFDRRLNLDLSVVVNNHRVPMEELH